MNNQKASIVETVFSISAFAEMNSIQTEHFKMSVFQFMFDDELSRIIDTSEAKYFAPVRFDVLPPLQLGNEAIDRLVGKPKMITALVFLTRGPTIFSSKEKEYKICAYAYVFQWAGNTIMESPPGPALLILPLSRHVTPAEYVRVRQLVQRTFGILDDPKKRSAQSRFPLPHTLEVGYKASYVKFNNGKLIDVDRALAYLGRSNSAAKGRHMPVKAVGNWSDVESIAKAGCSVVKKLITRIFEASLETVDKRTVTRAAQFGASVGMSVPDIVYVLNGTGHSIGGNNQSLIQFVVDNFKRPACDSLAVEFGVCDGCCEAISRTRSRSPLGLIDWNRTEV